MSNIMVVSSGAYGCGEGGGAGGEVDQLLEGIEEVVVEEVAAEETRWNSWKWL